MGWKIVFMEAAIHPMRQGETNGAENMSVVQKGGFDIQQGKNRGTVV